jgi:uncharacterized membrane protein YcaP (DUF421 family)
VFFDSWYDLARILVVGTAAYIGLVLVLRLGGKRTLSKMTAFDLVVTVALGSTLATVLLTGDVSLSEGMAAMALLALLQFLVAYASLHSRRFRALIKAEPAMLYFRGDFIDSMMRTERITPDDIRAAMRQQGFADMADVEAVVLETDGSLSVIAGGKTTKGDSALRDVKMGG